MANRIKPTEPLHLIRCNIGDETYGLDMSWVRTIERVDRLRRASERGISNAGFIGWLPSEESEIPVFSLARRLGHEFVATNASQRIIILHPPASPLKKSLPEEESLWALLVDQIFQMLKVAPDRFEPLPRIVDSNKNYFEGVLKLEQELLLLLSLEWLHPDTTLYTDEVIRETYKLKLTEVKFKDLQPERVVPDIAQDHSKTVLRQSNGTSLVKDNDRQGVLNRIRPGRLMLFSTQQHRSNGSVFGLSITQVSEVLQPLPITSVPTAPDFVLGLVNWRDYAVPVIDLDVRLGLATEASLSSYERSRLMIVRGSSERAWIGFPIQSSVRTLQLPIPYQHPRQTPVLKQPLVKGIFELEDKTLVIPNIDKILQPDA